MLYWSLRLICRVLKPCSENTEVGGGWGGFRCGVWRPRLPALKQAGIAPVKPYTTQCHHKLWHFIAGNLLLCHDREESTRLDLVSLCLINKGEIAEQSCFQWDSVDYYIPRHSAHLWSMPVRCSSRRQFGSVRIYANAMQQDNYMDYLQGVFEDEYSSPCSLINFRIHMSSNI